MPTRPTGRRARNRAARHDQLMAAATDIVTNDGLHGLTMKAVAERVGCAVGTIYTYFNSKSALLSALQVSAIQTLMDSYHEAAEIWEETLHPLSDSGWAPLRGLLTERWHFVQAPRPELYDRRADPSDRVDVAAKKPEIVREMSRRLAALGLRERKPEGWFHVRCGSASARTAPAAPSDRCGTASPTAPNTGPLNSAARCPRSSCAKDEKLLRSPRAPLTESRQRVSA